MRILGIDPGYATVGYGVLDAAGGRFRPVTFGAVTTPAGMPFPQRLQAIYTDLRAILQEHRPQALSIEKLFFNTNTTTAIDVAQARGVILLAAQEAGLTVAEYTPLQVKQSVTGYGRAEKFQVMEMTRQLLGLREVPKPDDTADALALAICHANTQGSVLGKLQLQTGGIKR